MGQLGRLLVVTCTRFALSYIDGRTDVLRAESARWRDIRAGIPELAELLAWFPVSGPGPAAESMPIPDAVGALLQSLRPDQIKQIADVLDEHQKKTAADLYNLVREQHQHKQSPEGPRYS